MMRNRGFTNNNTRVVSICRFRASCWSAGAILGSPTFSFLFLPSSCEIRRSGLH